MTVMIATFGGLEDLAKLGISQIENLNEVVLVVGKSLKEIYNKYEIKRDTEIIRPLNKVSEIEIFLKEFGISVKTHEVNPFDFKECLIKIIEIIHAQPENVEVILNVTGGTKTLTLAAMSASCICSCRAFIVQEKENKSIKIELPPDFGCFEKIGQREKILSYLIQEEQKLDKPIEECDDEQLRPFITKNIANNLGVHPQTIIPNLKNLEYSGYLVSRRGAIKRGALNNGKSSVKIWYLTGLLKEIQEKAQNACQVSKGTPAQKIACTANKEVQGWKIGSPEEMTLYVEKFISSLELKIPKLPYNKLVFKMIEESKNQKDIIKLFDNASELIDIIPLIVDPERMKPTIGIITALPKEYAAVNVLLENKNDKYKIPGYGAGRRYCLGEIPTEEGNKHNLVLVTVGMGNNIAATRASILLEHFPNVKSLIMVGIAGGVPNPNNVNDHVRLGDIVVSNENGTIQYDFIRQEIKEITHRNPPRPPSASLMEAARYLEAEEIMGKRPWEKYIDQGISQLKITCPCEDSDVLYCSGNQEKVIKHPEDPKRIKGRPRVFTGPIASANILQKDPKARDKLRDKFGVKAIEMEASGIADATWNHEVGYLVVRGICDYCDSHKNDEWQQYAAVVAAAYTRALIESMP